MIVARRSRLLPSCLVAVSVSSVDCPFTYNSRPKARTRSDRSCNVIDVHPKPLSLESRGRTSSRECCPPAKACWGRIGCHEDQDRRPSGGLSNIGFYHL